MVHIEEYFELGPKAVIAEARRIVGDGPAYVSFDVDGLDPVYAPGTGTPEVGGYSTAEAQQMLRGLAGLDLIGGDVVEVSPPFDPSGQHRPRRRDDDVRNLVRAGSGGAPPQDGAPRRQKPSRRSAIAQLRALPGESRRPTLLVAVSGIG